MANSSFSLSSAVLCSKAAGENNVMWVWYSSYFGRLVEGEEGQKDNLLTVGGSAELLPLALARLR